MASKLIRRKCFVQVAWILLGLVFGGCSAPYSENERLNYLDAAEKIIVSHETISQTLESDHYMAVPKNLDPLTELFNQFKAKYQATPLDEEYKLLSSLSVIENLAQDCNPARWDGSKERLARRDIAWDRYPEAITAAKAVIIAARQRN